MPIQTQASPSQPLFGKTVREQVGVNIHFTDAMPGEMDELGALGLGVIRMDFSWSATEKQLGVYDFSPYDKLLSDMEKHKIRCLWILDYGNHLYQDNDGNVMTESARVAFAKWAAAAVTHFKGHRILWEMWNEPNYTPWPYLELQQAVGKAIKTAQPDEIYIGPAEGGTDPKWIEPLFQGGALNYWDAVSVHPYRTSNPEQSTDELKKLQSLITQYQPAGANIPLLSGEWGYSVIPAGNTYSWVPSEAVQAAYFDREVLSNMANGLQLTIWYDWRNDNDKPADTEANFGLVYNVYQKDQKPVFDPKPSYFAAKTFMSMLGDFAFVNVAPAGSSTTALLYTFQKGSDNKYVAYTLSPTFETANLAVPIGKYTLYNMYGDILKTANADSSGLPVALTGEPQFVVPSN